MRKKVLFAALILLTIVFYRISTNPAGSATREIVHPEDDPTQGDLSDENTSTITLKASGYEWTLTPKALYQIAGRVLGTEKYYTNWQTTLSPVDLAIGWGELRNSTADQWIHWSQSGRWYFFQYSSGCPYSQDFIVSHSANVHIIPSTNNLKKAVMRLQRNDVVLLDGFLVNVDGRKGSANYWWHSSLSRSDTGDGSCELLYLNSLIANHKQFH